jgi:hypothetical protein
LPRLRTFGGLWIDDPASGSAARTGAAAPRRSPSPGTRGPSPARSGRGRVRRRDYADDRISEEQPRDYLLERYPEEVKLDARGRVDPELLRVARRRIAMDWQQRLATKVLMGINRIVVTGESIEASCRFELPAADEPSRMSERSR